MIKRIVKMGFQPDKVEAFKSIFQNNWKSIKAFEGCMGVELLQDKLDASIFFTYSIWQSEKHLDQYRESDLFSKVWSDTKVLFNKKPCAWTLTEVKF